MRVKEVLQRRDTLKGYLHSLAIARDFCSKNIGDDQLIGDLEGVYREIEKEFVSINESLRPFEDMDM